MTPFASVALFKRGNAIVFRPARKERPGDVTQARKAAMRFWSANCYEGDKLIKLFVVRELGGRLVVSERTTGEWTSYPMEPGEAVKQPHLAALMGEIGIDASTASPPMPDVIVINGQTYRKDI